ncbi:hypothetical protein K3163_11880 [Qipengyuania sp. 1NDW9]|uniref:hypothetical protein n=1 Tax=Qipengyuania xiapuensis TaxID=2867236 RepID=UPI001C87EEAF|nr:hypothetical protein [Qipengyuania xiapuensis]MBX7493905.1 hypothetical protein [Qipengyuania xiapuensis]
MASALDLSGGQVKGRERLGLNDCFGLDFDFPFLAEWPRKDAQYYRPDFRLPSAEIDPDQCLSTQKA